MDGGDLHQKLVTLREREGEDRELMPFDDNPFLFFLFYFANMLLK